MAEDVVARIHRFGGDIVLSTDSSADRTTCASDLRSALCCPRLHWPGWPGSAGDLHHRAWGGASAETRLTIVATGGKAYDAQEQAG